MDFCLICQEKDKRIADLKEINKDLREEIARLRAFTDDAIRFYSGIYSNSNTTNTSIEKLQESAKELIKTADIMEQFGDTSLPTDNEVVPNSIADSMPLSAEDVPVKKKKSLAEIFD